jgi:hypothetical protein
MKSRLDKLRKSVIRNPPRADRDARKRRYLCFGGPDGTGITNLEATRLGKEEVNKAEKDGVTTYRAVDKTEKGW